MNEYLQFMMDKILLRKTKIRFVAEKITLRLIPFTSQLFNYSSCTESLKTQSKSVKNTSFLGPSQVNTLSAARIIGFGHSIKAPKET